MTLTLTLVPIPLFLTRFVIAMGSTAGSGSAGGFVANIARRDDFVFLYTAGDNQTPLQRAAILFTDMEEHHVSWDAEPAAAKTPHKVYTSLPDLYLKHLTAYPIHPLTFLTPSTPVTRTANVPPGTSNFQCPQ